MTRPPAATGGKPWLIDFILLAAIWGSSFLFTRLSVGEFGAVPQAFMRVLVATLFLMPILLYQGHGPALRKNWPRAVAIGIVNTGIPFALFAYAVQWITTGMTAILNATGPLFGAIVAWLWLRDRLDSSRVIGLIVGFLGVAMLAWDGADFKAGASDAASGWAILACLAACVCYGIGASYTKRYTIGLPTLVVATGAQAGASLGLALPAIWLWPVHTPGLNSWLAILVVGVLCTGVAYILFYRIVANTSPSRALSVSFGIPVFAVIYGAIFLHEAITLWMLGCAAVIVLGTALSTGLLRLWRAGA